VRATPSPGAAACGPQRALWLLAAAWLLIAAGWRAAPWLGTGNAALLSFGAGACLVWAMPLRGAAHPAGTRAGVARRAGASRAWRRGVLPALLGLAAGYVLFVPWLLATWHAGGALGLDPAWLGAPVAPLAGEPSLWIAGVVLAPLFEERLYRGHLLAPLRGRLGATGALAVTSALFALPHLAPWNVLGTFLGGLGLGAFALASGGLVLPIAVHAGLNLAAVSGGVPPVERALPADASLALGAVFLAAALAPWRRAPAPPRGSLAIPPAACGARR
jgi:membrane protease YdiL (CAAX protease family)